MQIVPLPTLDKHIRDIIAEQLGKPLDDVVDTAAIKEDLDADSLDAIELTITFEEEFDIEIPDDEAEKLLLVGQIVTYIEEKVKAKPAE